MTISNEHGPMSCGQVSDARWPLKESADLQTSWRKQKAKAVETIPESIVLTKLYCPLSGKSRSTSSAKAIDRSATCGMIAWTGCADRLATHWEIRARDETTHLIA
jgi:hypothetical protein